MWDARAFLACSGRLVYVGKNLLVELGYHNRRGFVAGIGFGM